MSFRLRTILGIAAIEIVLLTILVVSSLNYLQSSNKKQFKERARTTVQLLATMTTDAVVAMDLATLDSLIAESLKNPDIGYVRIRARTGAVLAEGGASQALENANKGDDKGEIIDGRIDVSQEIVVSGKTFGDVELGINAGDLDSTMKDATRWMLWIAGIEIALVAIFGVLLGNMLTGQLREIQRGARRVAAGELGYRIPVRGRDELADTARSFNAMSDALEHYASNLQEARKLAEQRRDVAESTLHDAIANLSEGVIIADQAGVVTRVNKTFRRTHMEVMAAHEPASLSDIDGTISAFVAVSADGLATVEDLARTPRMSGTLNRFGAAREGDQWTIRYHDGRTFLYSASGMANGGRVIAASEVTAIYDAEETARKLQREHMQGQKLEAIGTLAGGIAHELNTPIQFIGDNLHYISDACAGLLKIVGAHEALISDLGKGTVDSDALARLRNDAVECDTAFLREELPLAIQQSSDGIVQMANIVLAMKEFAYPTAKEKSPVGVNHALERALLVSRNEWKYVADIDRALTEPEPVALVNEGELNQVLLNIVVNAAHAISSAERTQGKITVRTYVRDEFVTIEIGDNGTGIPEEIRDRVFEQFFTTKDVGKGTGQGLALCNEFIANRNDGRLHFETLPDQGTTFFIELPIAHPPQ